MAKCYQKQTDVLMMAVPANYL